MNDSFIFSEIIAELGWFEANQPFQKLDDVNFVHYINGSQSINKDTTIAYFPGCFAQFHDGHLSVIQELRKFLEKTTINYVIVIAPANSDYTVSKYGANSVYASNKYRFDRIVEVLKGFQGNIAIDLNPMLNNDRDYNFTDLLKDFVERHIEKFDDLTNTPYIVCGKDRANFQNLEKFTDKIRVFYGDDTTNLSSSGLIKQNPKQFVKKTCYVRCNNTRQFISFMINFSHHYKEVHPVYLSEELENAMKIALVAEMDVTICKEYADILPYVPFHRNFIHPLITNNTHTGDINQIKGKRVLDSDIFTGGTLQAITDMDGHLEAVMDFRWNLDQCELVDFNDFYDDNYRYPHYDIAERCSMKPFTTDDHEQFVTFKQHIKKHISRDIE